MGRVRLLQTLTQIQDFPEASRAEVILGHVGSFVWLLWVSLKSVGLSRAGLGWTLHGLPLLPSARLCVSALGPGAEPVRELHLAAGVGPALSEGLHSPYLPLLNPE